MGITQKIHMNEILFYIIYLIKKFTCVYGGGGPRMAEGRRVMIEEDVKVVD